MRAAAAHEPSAQSLLYAATPAGQEYRLSQLHNRVLVFISAGYSGKKFIFEKAKELGVLSVIIDNPGTWSSELAITGTIKRFIPIDMEGPTVVQDIVSALQGLNDEVRRAHP
jgi:S1-C subfamily serine protease